MGRWTDTHGQMKLSARLSYYLPKLIKNGQACQMNYLHIMWWTQMRRALPDFSSQILQD